MLMRDPPRLEHRNAATLAHIVSAIMFLSMAATINISKSVDEILAEISEQIYLLLPIGGTRRSAH